MEPRRSGSGRRLYSDQDVDHLLLLARAVAGGRRIGDVAGLAPDKLEILVREDEAAAAAPARGRPAASSNGAGDLLRRCLAAVEALDERGLEEALADASVALSGPSLRRDVLLPLMREVGEGWQQGRLRVAHEHLATALVRTFLGALRNARRLPPGAPQVVVTTPAGQRHELGALMAAAIAAEAGWDVTYLGPDLPAEEIAAAARQRGAKAVALGITFPDEARLADELRRLRRALGADTAILAGGRGSEAAAGILREVGGQLAASLEDLPVLLDRLQRRGPASSGS